MNDWTKSKWWYFTLAVLGLLCGIIGYKYLGPKPAIHRAAWTVPESDYPHKKDYQRLREERNRYYAEIGRPHNELDDMPTP